MARKFNKKAFRDWLDNLCKVVVKTRDDFTCQRCGKYLKHEPFNCQWCHIKGRNRNNLRWDLYNDETLDGACHTWVHNNPDIGWDWLLDKNPVRKKYINDKMKEPIKTWREDDFREVEAYLIQKAKDFGVEWNDIRIMYQPRLRKLLHGN